MVVSLARKMNRRNAHPVISEVENQEEQENRRQEGEEPEEEVNSEADTEAEDIEARIQKERTKEVTRVVNHINGKIKLMDPERRKQWTYQGREHENVSSWEERMVDECETQQLDLGLWGRVMCQFVAGKAEKLLKLDKKKFKLKEWQYGRLMARLNAHFNTADKRSKNRAKFLSLRLVDYESLEAFLEAWWSYQERHGIQDDMAYDDQIHALCNCLTFDLKHRVRRELPVFTKGEADFQDLFDAVEKVKKCASDIDEEKKDRRNNNFSLSLSLSREGTPLLGVR